MVISNGWCHVIVNFHQSTILDIYSYTEPEALYMMLQHKLTRVWKVLVININDALEHFISKTYEYESCLIDWLVGNCWFWGTESKSQLPLWSINIFSCTQSVFWIISFEGNNAICILSIVFELNSNFDSTSQKYTCISQYYIKNFNF